MALILLTGVHAYKLPTALGPVHSGAVAPLRQPRTVAPCMEAEAFATVIFLRHGQSVWNEASLFTGWCGSLSLSLSTRHCY